MKRSKYLYWALICTFISLYACVAFVSTIHAISFFQLGNISGLAILLGISFEIGQSSVLFAILLTDNKNRFLAWMMMFLLTAVQITANVYSTFRFIDLSGLNDWTYWQRVILFAVQADSPEMYKVIIAYIQGAILPLIALGMTALVAENLRLARGEKLGEIEDSKDDKIEEKLEKESKEVTEKSEEKQDEIESEEFDDLLDLQNQLLRNQLQTDKEEIPKVDVELETKKVDVEPSKIDILNIATEINGEKGNKKEKSETDLESITKEIDKEISERIVKIPINKVQGWHFMNEFIDDEYNIFQKGEFLRNDPNKIPTSKKV